MQRGNFKQDIKGEANKIAGFDANGLPIYLDIDSTYLPLTNTVNKTVDMQGNNLTINTKDGSMSFGQMYDSWYKSKSIDDVDNSYSLLSDLGIYPNWSYNNGVLEIGNSISSYSRTTKTPINGNPSETYSVSSGNKTTNDGALFEINIAHTNQPSGNYEVRIDGIYRNNEKLISSEQAVIWADKYTKGEIDNKFITFSTNIDWKGSVATFADLATAYPTPEQGWTVTVTDTGDDYRYDGTAWVNIGNNSVPMATATVDGRMSKEQFAIIRDLSLNYAAKSHQHSTDDITTEGTNKWWTNARTLSSILTGYAKATASAALDITTTVLTALGILEFRLDNLDVSKATIGALPDARLSSNVPLKNTSNVFTNVQYVEGIDTVPAFATRNVGGAHAKFAAYVNGREEWGDGTNPRDTFWERIGVGLLRLTGTLTITGNLQAGNVVTNAVNNPNTSTNSSIQPTNIGTEIRTSISGNVAAKIINSISNATGDIMQWIKGSTVLAKMDANGVLDAQGFKKAGSDQFVDVTNLTSGSVQIISDIPSTEITKLTDPLNWTGNNYTGTPLINCGQGARAFLTIDGVKYRVEMEEDNIAFRTN